MTKLSRVQDNCFYMLWTAACRTPVVHVHVELTVNMGASNQCLFKCNICLWPQTSLSERSTQQTVTQSVTQWNMAVTTPLRGRLLSPIFSDFFRQQCHEFIQDLRQSFLTTDIVHRQVSQLICYNHHYSISTTEQIRFWRKMDEFVKFIILDGKRKFTIFDEIWTENWKNGQLIARKKSSNSIIFIGFTMFFTVRLRNECLQLLQWEWNNFSFTKLATQIIHSFWT